MDKRTLLQHVGSIEQIGGVRDFTYHGGKADGMRAIEINTGCLRFTILPDRCLDIAQAEYAGAALSWISKTGITAPSFYEKDGLGWLRGFYGGLLVTCGLRNIGFPSQVDGEVFGQHGRMSNTPAERVSVFADWVGEEYVMKVSGVMRESVVFGENLVLKRTLTAKLFGKTIEVEDTLVNEGFADEQVGILYHCNFGYPQVRKDARIVLPKVLSAHPVTPYAQSRLPLLHEICDVQHGVEEECVHLRLEGERIRVGIDNGDTSAYIEYDQKQLPAFTIWKMLGEGDYVVGLEPGTTHPKGRGAMDLITLGAQEEYKVSLILGVD